MYVTLIRGCLRNWQSSHISNSFLRMNLTFPFTGRVVIPVKPQRSRFSSVCLGTKHTIELHVFSQPILIWLQNALFLFSLMGLDSWFDREYLGLHKTS
ncbi:hypothetical protein VNO78_10748 [Psophocarpus tetragonolobus]|uniref:Uncharacterized protein n=1 Tax=Psophocarpus tetragonolobus TaxID=3891 RepID=A0AAN9XMI2_PSOTE